MNAADQPPVRIINPRGSTPKGFKDFTQVIQQKRCFVDKSLFIQEILDNDDKVVLITRPRRFGKTTNQSMLQAFFEKPAAQTDTAALFEGLLVAQQTDIMQHQGQYPVISLTFKDVRADCWNQAYDKLCDLVYEEIQRHPEASDFESIDLFARTHGASWNRILQQEKATLNDWESALKLLCKLLTLHHNQGKPQHEWIRPIVLLDEYDAPIHTAYMHTDKATLKRPQDPACQDAWRREFDASYYGKMVNFIGGLLGMALKDNDEYLHKAVITGILRVAKENIFSGLNNLGTFGVLQEEFASHFGFTQSEVEQLLAARDLSHRLPDVQCWYNGYAFGTDEITTVYNPWSIVSFLASKTHRLEAYWANTSSNELIHSLINASSLQDKQHMETLLLDETVTKDVSETLALQDVQTSPDTLYSILLCSGYLTPQQTHVGGAQSRQAHLRIPNEEIHTIYQQLVQQWFARGSVNPLPTVLQALQEGDLEQFAQQLHQLSDVTLSYFDVAQQPEWFYHALVLGMVAYMSNTHFVRSNVESGDGRPDILLIPRDNHPPKPGIVMEIKRVDSPEHLATAAQQGLQQIDVKRYRTIFNDHPTSTLFAVAIAFYNKQAVMQYKPIDAA